MGAPHPYMGTCSQCLQEGLFQVRDAPSNEAALPELSSEHPTELRANLHISISSFFVQSQSAFLLEPRDVNRPILQWAAHSFFITPPYGSLSVAIVFWKRVLKLITIRSIVLGVYFPSLWIVILQIRETEQTCLRRKGVGTEPSDFSERANKGSVWGKNACEGKIRSWEKTRESTFIPLKRFVEWLEETDGLSFMSCLTFKFETDHLSWKNPDFSFCPLPCWFLCPPGDYSEWHFFSCLIKMCLKKIGQADIR